jgi:hypothetical protein
MRDEDVEAQSYTWNWFALHSGQRMQLVNFWLVAIAFLAGAYVQAQSSHLRLIALGVSLTGTVASVSFMRLDHRTRQMILVAELALRQLEERRTMNGADETAELVSRSHRARNSFFDSYRVLIQGLQLLVAVIFVLAAVYSIVAHLLRHAA